MDQTPDRIFFKYPDNTVSVKFVKMLKCGTVLLLWENSGFYLTVSCFFHDFNEN